MAEESELTAHRPRIAAFNIAEADRLRFLDAFHKVKLAVEVIPLTALPARETFDAAVLQADNHAKQLLTALRSRSPRMVIYLVGATEQVAPLAHFGVNAALEAMTDAAVSRAVENTYLLLAGRLRRYTRIPIYVPVTLQLDQLSFTAITQDLSGGGISLHGAPSASVRVGQAVIARLVLPGTEPLNLSGIICRVSGGQLGVQFARGTDQERLRQWVDDFLA